MTEQQFLESADTFDVLLFRCNSKAAKVIRGYTNSEYDHAAMVLRFDSQNASKRKDVYILEATGSGVTIRKWSQMKGHYGHGVFARVVLRHVVF